MSVRLLAAVAICAICDGQASRWPEAEQPLTCGMRTVSAPGKLSPVEKIEIESSDVISFHVYSHAAVFKRDAVWLGGYHRPVLCTEYLARSLNSTFESTLPLAKKLHIGAYNWGLVNGKTQTHLPWDSWEKPYGNREPELWVHDIFHADGRPYRVSETGREGRRSTAPAQGWPERSEKQANHPCTSLLAVKFSARSLHSRKK
jgi:hypothetical protein